MKTINLTQGKVTLVDDESFEGLNQHKWYAHKDGNTFYAVRITAKPNQIKIRMHRAIMDVPEGLQVDHINGDGLDNRKSNLRIVTSRQNCQNRHGNKSSIFPGVDWNKGSKKWRARITVNGRCICLGYFKIEIEAYSAYLNALGELGEIPVDNIAI